MDSAALPSLSPLLDGIDRWAELAPLLPVIIALEFVLSADNAVALAAITRRLTSIELQKRALNVGIFIALFFRIILILLASWILNFWLIKLVAGIYLIVLFVSKVIETRDRNNNEKDIDRSSPNNISFVTTVTLLAFTDLAFSIDSVAAAVSISDQLLLVVTGAIIGVVALRFTSGLFIRWLEIYPRLELAGYIAVGLVGLKLILLLLIPALVIPEWFILVFVFLLFTWGFSHKNISDSI